MREVPTARRTALTGVVGIATALSIGAGTAHAQQFELGGERFPVDSVLVSGNQVYQVGPLLGTIGIFPGDTVGYVDIVDAEKRLWATGSFSDVRVFAEEGPDGSAVLSFEIDEYPVIRQQAIEGLETIGEQGVFDAIELSPGLAYSPRLLVDARRYIQDELSERGIPFAEVTEELEPLDVGVNGARWVLHVTEGQRVTIAEVAFNGNNSISDGDLAGRMTSSKEGFFWFQDGAFNPEELDEDLRTALPEFYASRGFIDFRVLGDTIIIDPSSGKARLEIDVEEGPRYRVGNLTIEGNRQFPTETIEDYYRPEERGILASIGFGGDDEEGLPPVFDQAAFNEATGEVGTLYQNSGYLYSQVSPLVERRPAETEDGYPTVDLSWLIQEGEPAYIRRIDIVGNDYTHDRVIRERISLLPGDVYSQERLFRSYQAISGLGFFESPLPLPQIQPDEVSGDVDITFEVAERQTGTFNFGTTVGGGTGLSGFIGFDEPNLWGQAKAGSVRWDFGRYQNSFSLQYTDPALFLSRVSGSISLYNSTDRFYQFTTGERRVVGASTQLGFPVPGSIFSRVFVGYSISRTEYDQQRGETDTSLFGRASGLQSQLSVSIARSTLDHPLFPTIGSQQRWTTEFNGGFLGGDGTFTRHLAEGAWWVPIGTLGENEGQGGGMTFALGLKTRAGFITGDATDFPFERFWLGGVQFGEALRGYEETTLTPLGYFDRSSGAIPEGQRLGDAFMTIGAEYAFRLNQSISVSAFYEAGGIWRNVREINPSKLYRGAGIGLSLVTPFGPFGLDYGYGFDRAEPGWELHFQIGGQQSF